MKTRMTQDTLWHRFAEKYPTAETFSSNMLYEFMKELRSENENVRPGTATGLLKRLDMVKRGTYRLYSGEFENRAPATNVAPAMQATPAPAPDAESAIAFNTALTAGVRSIRSDEVYIPDGDETFVSWGHFVDIKKIIESGNFFPTYVHGLSGNGKTMMIQQACAQLNREYVRVQIHPASDEDDLLGGFRLINGETVFAKGPVVKSMERGAILLIDEIDRGSNKLMCLQGVLEGKPILLKKTGEVIKPAPGFNVFATANTRGQGDDTGKFISAGILDDAFLERFVVSIEQPYPSDNVEKKIVLNNLRKNGIEEDDFADVLVRWSAAIRKSYRDEVLDECVSTRRVCHIVDTYAIFKNRSKAIDLCLNRFDEDVRVAMVELYNNLDVSTMDNSNVADPDDLTPF